MLRVNDLNRIYLGIQGENQAREISIDVSEWLVNNEQGSVTIWHKRNGDSVPSATGAVFDSENQVVVWSPTDTDTYVSGEGVAEIRLTEGSVIKKSRAVITGVSQSVTGSGVPLGSDWQSYINAVDSLRAAAVLAKTAAETAATAAGTSEENAEAWAVGTRDGEPVEDTDDTYHNNSKYYAEAAADDAAAASTAATDAQAAKDAAETAQGKAETAQGKAEDAQDAAEAAADEIQTAGAEAETLAAGSDATAQIVRSNGTMKFKFGIPRGATGAGSLDGIVMNGNEIPADDHGIVNLGTVITTKNDKADKVANVTAGNFAGLDANGNLVDSGHKHSDYLTSHQSIAGKADKVTGATNNNFAALDSNGNLIDSGHKHGDYIEKVTTAGIEGYLPKFTSDGGLTYSLFTPSSFKPRQSSRSSPAAFGHSDEFIHTITQNAEGIISATKRTVQDASSSQHGLMSAADKALLDNIPGDLAIVEDDADNEAQHNIAAGQYVCWKGVLHKASAAIVAGETLSASNLTAVTSGGLNSLSDQITNLTQWTQHSYTQNTTVWNKFINNSYRMVFKSNSLGEVSVNINCSFKANLSRSSDFETLLTFSQALPLSTTVYFQVVGASAGTLYYAIFELSSTTLRVYNGVATGSTAPWFRNFSVVYT